MGEERFDLVCGGERLRGILHLPDGRPLAALVTTGPLSSVKEQAAGAYAKALAARDFAVLAFDHRHFGESGGEPRQLESPTAKIEDIRAAAAALRADARMRDLPLAGIGVCLGGGYMAQAVAGEPLFAAFAGVAGVYADAEQTRRSMGEAYDAALARARAAEARWQAGGGAETIPAVAADGGDVGMPLREAYEYYGTPRGAVPNYVNGFAVQSRRYTLPFDAQSAAPRIDVPTLIVHSEKALAPALARRFFDALTAPKRELWLPSQGQIDFYDDPAIIGPAADAVAAFLVEVLGLPLPRAP